MECNCLHLFKSFKNCKEWILIFLTKNKGALCEMKYLYLYLLDYSNVFLHLFFT